MARLIGVVCVVVFCLLSVGCSGVQQAVVTSQTRHEFVARACVDALSDIDYVLTTHDLATGYIVARPGLTGEESYSKLEIVLAKTAGSVTVSVKYTPTSGARVDRGVVGAFVKALKKRLPDIAVSGAFRPPLSCRRLPQPHSAILRPETTRTSPASFETVRISS